MHTMHTCKARPMRCNARCNARRTHRAMQCVDAPHRVTQVRHPNLLEPWTSHVYAQLRDADLRVRKNTLLVLTHLILNDMVKVKGQVAEMALCLVDAEPRVTALARLFFTEFAKKGSAPVYNLLPDIMSSLSANSAVTPEAFREVMGFLIGFISKDKQTEAMTEK
eukprot:scaffold54066_cov63-Phaeocystis_antarctica.AAC.2